MRRILLLSLIVAGLLAISCNKDKNTHVETKKVFYSWTTFTMGADLSYVNEIEDFEGVYKDSGVVTDPYLIFKNHGANLVRVRLWHNPQWVGSVTNGRLYSDLADAEKTISRAKKAGMAVNLDFHYSDEWADPQHQNIPAAWQGLDLQTLSDSLYNYTLATLNHLKSKDLTPEMVQIGNEINTGLLWPAGQVKNDNWSNTALLVKSGIKAVRDFSETSEIKPLIMLHVAQFQNVEWWTKGMIEKGGVTDFDIIGISHYPKWSTFNSMVSIEQSIRNLISKYSKKVMIAETAYPWTGENGDSYNNLFSPADSVAGYSLTPEGQYSYMKELTQRVFNAGGSGIMYWEPAWITSNLSDKWGQGSAWENCTFFDFQGNTLKGIDFMTFDYKGE